MLSDVDPGIHDEWQIVNYLKDSGIDHIATLFRHLAEGVGENEKETSVRIRVASAKTRTNNI
jgi:hypothetical protein